MQERLNFYIGGNWTAPVTPKSCDVINPATEEAYARISLASRADVDKAVAAARSAFDTFSRSTREERLALLRKILAIYQKRYGEVAETISREMGAPLAFSKAAQAASGVGHLNEAIRVLEKFQFQRIIGSTATVLEPVGTCGFITPWNWPINQITCKVAPALATGCTMVLKPSEVAPMSGLLFAEILDEADVPPGVFNLVNGDGPVTGEAMSTHPDIDMISFTGSTRAGIAVAKAAADTVKRVAQELGGKSANIILDDADLYKAVSEGAQNCFRNSGQSCNAPSRMLVPRAKLDQATEIAKFAAEQLKVGNPFAQDTTIGPVVSKLQFNRIQTLIKAGMDEGAILAAGGLGRPEGLDHGFYVRPTVFSRVANDMTIARQEIFGPVLAILPYDTEAEAIDMANDTIYGLSGYVQSGSIERARAVAARLRTGMVHLNGAEVDFRAPFGGYKQSGNGREWGEFGFDDFLEVKSVFGYQFAGSEP